MNKHSRMPQWSKIGLLFIAGLTFWYGVYRGDLPAEAAFSDDPPAAAPPAAAAKQTIASGAEQLAAISVPAITLPNFEPVMPPGEGREIFLAVCVTCHSPRLVLCQPSFPRDKWKAAVQKMVDVFGAVISDENKSKTVDYLVSIRGTENDSR